MNLFHYTDVNAVKSILENKKLWLTDVRFLNDSTEMKEGFDFLLSYLNHQVSRHPHSKELEAGMSYVEQVVYKRDGYGLDRRPVFVSSFSQSGDLLSQWRAYGGYAIEFDSELMGENLIQCVYDDDEKLHSTPALALGQLLVVGRSINNNDGLLDHDAQEALAGFIGLAATLKHQSFSEEQEHRIIMGHDIDPDVDDGYEVRFRARGDMLIPYLELGINLECIKSINVGPMRDQELAFASMKAFVKKVCDNEFDSHQTYLGEIKVTTSSIPFRP